MAVELSQRGDEDTGVAAGDAEVPALSGVPHLSTTGRADRLPQDVVGLTWACPRQAADFGPCSVRADSDGHSHGRQSCRRRRPATAGDPWPGLDGARPGARRRAPRGSPAVELNRSPSTSGAFQFAGAAPARKPGPAGRALPRTSCSALRLFPRNKVRSGPGSRACPSGPWTPAALSVPRRGRGMVGTATTQEHQHHHTHRKDQP